MSNALMASEWKWRFGAIECCWSTTDKFMNAKVDTEMDPMPDKYTLASYILFPLVFGLCSLVFVCQGEL